MPTSRDISESEWEAGRKKLVRYFISTHCFDAAEDLAQTTITELWRRADYVFEDLNDFNRVLFAFASNVAKAYRRRLAQRREVNVEDWDRLSDATVAEAVAEVSIEQALADLKERLEAKGRKHQWDILAASLEGSRSRMAELLGLTGANAARVLLNRTIRKVRGSFGQ